MKRVIFLLLSIVFLLCLLPITDLLAATYAYVPSYGDDNATRIDTDSETFDKVNISGGLYGAAVMPNGSYILITRTTDDQLAKVSNSNFSGAGSVASIAVGASPRGVAIDSVGSYAYVANFDDDNVTIVDLPSFAAVGTVGVGSGPWGVAARYDEDLAANLVYVSNYTDDSISVITDDGSSTSVETISSVGNGPVGVALTPDGAYLYVALYNNGLVGSLVVIRTSDNSVVQTIGLQSGPWGAAVGSDGDYAFITNSESDSVSVIRTSDRVLLGSFVVGDQPMGVAAAKNGDFAYVVNQLGNSISRISVPDGTVTVVGSGELDGAFALGAFIGGTPPSAPTGLSAQEASSSRITLTWTDNASNEAGFKIERRKHSDSTFSQISKVAANTTTYEDSGLEGDTTYDYRIRAYTEAADSDYTATSSATTEAGSFSWCFIGTAQH